MCSPQNPEKELLIIEKAEEGLWKREVEELCALTGAQQDDGDRGGRSLTVDFFYTECRVRLPGEEGGSVSVTNRESGEALSLKERIVLLYYLKTAKGTPLLEDHITFRELKGSGFYYPTMEKRTGWLFKRFEGREGDLPGIAPKIGGKPLSLGDGAAEFMVLPRVPISLVLWKGDDEFPPKQSILFDRSVSDYLPTECTIVATEILLKKLVKLL